MKYKLQILRQIEKNQTYESIRFNNKQISDQIIKNAIEEHFPKIFVLEKSEKQKDLLFFIKAMKDQEFYNKIRAMIVFYLGLENHLDQIEQKINQKSKIQDLSCHQTEQFNRKKMTRAALAKKNQLTQQQLRKDQIYVRLTPKSQYCLQWMLCNRNFPRIQCKLSCNQHIQYLVNYLSNKWLKGKCQNRIVLYPDVGTYLKNSLSPKQRQKIIKQPLNNYYMFTDIMVGSGIGQNGILNLQYDIVQKKVQGLRNGGLSSNNMNQSKQSNDTNKKNMQIQIDSQKKIVSVNEINKKQDSILKYSQKMSGIEKQKLNPNKSGMQINPQNINKSTFFNKNQISNAHQIHSNHFLSNQSNLLNPNKSIYFDDQSIFKSIGFFGLNAQPSLMIPPNNNSIGFNTNNMKKVECNLMSINSNSYLDIQDNFLQKNASFADSNFNPKLKKNQTHKNLKEQKLSLNRSQKQQILNKQNSVKMEAQSSKSYGFSNLNNLKKQQNEIVNQKKQDQKSQQKQKPQKNDTFPQVKIESQPQTKKHNQKLVDLRNAINFLQVAEGLQDSIQQPPNQQISQRSSFKQIKTVSIKKKGPN